MVEAPRRSLHSRKKLEPAKGGTVDGMAQSKGQQDKNVGKIQKNKQQENGDDGLQHSHRSAECQNEEENNVRMSEDSQIAEPEEEHSLEKEKAHKKSSPSSNRVPKSLEAKRPPARGNSPGARTTPSKKQKSPSKPPVSARPVPSEVVLSEVREGGGTPEKLCVDEIQQDQEQQQPEVKLVNGNALHLLKLAKASHISGDNPMKAIDYASRAATLFEREDGEIANLELVLCLHIVAAGYCRLKKYEEAINVLESSLVIPSLEQGSEHALAMFAGHMQLGDTWSLTGQHGKALACYHRALDIQKQVLGDMDPRVADTCRYLSEAHLQVMQLDEAEELCEWVLNIHSKHSPAGSLDEAVDRKLMALIYSAKGEYEAALEQLVLASTTLSCSGQDTDVASVDCSIGEAYVALGRYDEAVFSYQKALTVLKSVKGDSHTAVAFIYVSLAELYLRTGKQREAKTYCENALRILGKHNSGHAPDELASGLVEVAGVFEAMGEREQALSLLKRSLEMIQSLPGEQSAAAGVEAQMGVLHYVMSRYFEAYDAFKSAVSKLRLGSDKETGFLGLLYHQMGLVSVELDDVPGAVEHLEEARRILTNVLGPEQPDTLAVCSNLAGCYDALGRVDEAIGLLESVVGVREESLGTVHPDVARDRERLVSLLRAVGRSRTRKTSTLEELLLLPNVQTAAIAAAKATS